MTEYWYEVVVTYDSYEQTRQSFDTLWEAENMAFKYVDGALTRTGSKVMRVVIVRLEVAQRWDGGPYG
jgi:hypothetical protein